MIIATVTKRGCGFPKEGGFYAIGSGRPKVCFALPVEIKPCSCCNQMPMFSRCPSRVASEYLEQLFSFCWLESPDKCHVCIRNSHTYWLSWIGSDYTADSFVQEVRKQGLSRRIPPSFAKLIQPGDYFANVKMKTVDGEKKSEIISIVPITSVRYYVKPTDSEEKIKELEDSGIETAMIEIKKELTPEQLSI